MELGNARHSLTVVVLAGLTISGLISPRIASAGAARSSHSAKPVATLAHVRFIDRGLSVRPPNHARRKGKVKEPLYNRYFLQTQARQRASIGFRDGTTLHINQRTDAVLASPHITLVKNGEVDEVLKPGTNHQIQTAQATASAIGTEFDVRRQGSTSVFIVAHGAVLVKNRRGSVVVKTNHESVVTGNQAPGKPQPVDASAATAWTNGIPTPKLGDNLALDANGGQIVDVSSQRSGGEARRIDDGLLGTAWESAPRAVSNQHLTLGFEGQKIFMVSGVLIDGAAQGSTSTQTDLKTFDVRYSNTGIADRDFGTLVSGTLKQTNQLQWFAFSHPIAVRYLQLVAKSNYGSADGISVTELEAVGVPNTGHIFNFPQGIAVNPQGNLDLVDATFEFIQRVSPAGKLLATLGQEPGRIGRPSGLAEARDGTIYVVDNRGSVLKFSASGKLLLQWGSTGSGPGQFANALGIATDAQGNVYVVDSNNDRIQKFSSDGRFQAQFGGRGTGPGQFSYGPFGIAVDGQGNMYVTEPATALVTKLAPNGQQVARWGSFGSGPGQFKNPEGIAVDEQGNVYVADAEGSRIEKFTSDGKYVTAWPTPGATPSAPPVRPEYLAVDRQGNVYVTTGVYGQVVQKYSPSGQLLATWE